MEISKKDMKILLKSQQGELDAVLMYNALAEVAKDQKDKDTFRQLAKEEGHHPDPNDPDSRETLDEQDGQFPEGMFRFEKRIER